MGRKWAVAAAARGDRSGAEGASAEATHHDHSGERQLHGAGEGGGGAGERRCAEASGSGEGGRGRLVCEPSRREVEERGDGHGADWGLCSRGGVSGVRVGFVGGGCKCEGCLRLLE